VSDLLGGWGVFALESPGCAPKHGPPSRVSSEGSFRSHHPSVAYLLTQHGTTANGAVKTKGDQPTPIHAVHVSVAMSGRNYFQSVAVMFSDVET
jgi:hypothetical protein